MSSPHALTRVECDRHRLYFWPLLFRLHGSPFPRTVPFAILSVGIQVTLHLSRGLKESMQAAFVHPYGFQVYAFVIGFLVVLRTNHALARFMEARGHVEQMGSKWWGLIGGGGSLLVFFFVSRPPRLKFEI